MGRLDPMFRMPPEYLQGQSAAWVNLTLALTIIVSNNGSAGAPWLVTFAGFNRQMVTEEEARAEGQLWADRVNSVR